MSYTALAEMRKLNKARYGIDGPLSDPKDFGRPESRKVNDKLPRELEQTVLRFLRERCEGLRFDLSDENRRELKDFDGTSTKAGQIPFNMEKDIDRLCMENALHNFFARGTASAAFNVYFCYLEMFLGSYGSCRQMIEMLAEFESNGSSLLMKHRDHYSHSVYVFAIGLACYEALPAFRKTYADFYGLGDPEDGIVRVPEKAAPKYAAAHHFLKYWGLAALFHDIGYPFELPFEQVKSYFGDRIDGVPFLAYQGVAGLDQPWVIYEQKAREAEKAAKKAEKKAAADPDSRELAEKAKTAREDADRAACFAKEKKAERIRQIAKLQGRESDKPGLGELLAENLSEKLSGFYRNYQSFRAWKENHPEIRDTEKAAGASAAADDRAAYTEYLKDSVINRKAEHPDEFSGFMDHAYFSACILLRNLFGVLKEEELCKEYADVASAILLHNSMYKFCITNVKGDDRQNHFNAEHHFRPSMHPLAWMLMLCDELQCWDRTAYGKNSRTQYHPMWCDITFPGGNGIRAEYYYDERLNDGKHTEGTIKKMREPEGAVCSFQTDIEDIIDVNDSSASPDYDTAAGSGSAAYAGSGSGTAPKSGNAADAGSGNDTAAGCGKPLAHSGITLEIAHSFLPNHRNTQEYISSSNFMHLYEFGVVLNAQYSARNYDTKEWEGKTSPEMLEMFEGLSLEYKLSNIMQAEAFGSYLNAIGCFYTDRPVVYPLKESFSVKQLNEIGEKEHIRWEEEKRAMGWQHDTRYEEAFPEKAPDGGPTQTLVRERTRTHKSLDVAYRKLDEKERNKDTEPMNDMLKLIKEFDGLRVYEM